MITLDFDVLKGYHSTTIYDYENVGDIIKKEVEDSWINCLHQFANSLLLDSFPLAVLKGFVLRGVCLPIKIIDKSNLSDPRYFLAVAANKRMSSFLNLISMRRNLYKKVLPNDLYNEYLGRLDEVEKYIKGIRMKCDNLNFRVIILSHFDSGKRTFTDGKIWGNNEEETKGKDTSNRGTTTLNNLFIKNENVEKMFQAMRKVCILNDANKWNYGRKTGAIVAVLDVLKQRSWIDTNGLTDLELANIIGNKFGVKVADRTTRNTPKYYDELVKDLKIYIK